MELLAPAGTLQAFEAALEAGADAVYVGAPGFNARALARDFSFPELAVMCKVAHAKGKKLYVAMNSLMKEDEVRSGLETLHRLSDIRPDALIVQDIGIVELVRRYFPQMPLHASTLMTVNNSAAANYFKKLGFQRIVLARELSIGEIEDIHQHSGVELEIFIHGAMCFSYSGLCRFSSLHGGKSSLRGQCVQPCRRRYDWLPSGKRNVSSHFGKGGGYLFSMNDLSGIEHLADVRKAGVVCLKIEGRLKSVEYVRNTVRAYRLALDALEASPAEQKEMAARARQYLEEALSRKRAPGFLVPGQEERLIQPRLSGSVGEVVGKVVKVETPKGKNRGTAAVLHVHLQNEVNRGDRLRFYDERTGDRRSFTLRLLEVNGRQEKQGRAGQLVTISVPDTDAGALGHAAQGVLFRVDISGRDEKHGSSLAKKAGALSLPPLDASVVSKMLRELWRQTEEDGTGGNAPSSRQRQRAHHAGAMTPEWWIKVRSLEALGQRFPFKVAKVLLDLNAENLAYYLSRKKKGHSTLVWSLPPIISETQVAWYKEAILQLQVQGGRHFQVSHLGQLALFPPGEGQGAAEPLWLYGDSTCNVLNSIALQAWAAQGMAGMQFSLEIDRESLVSMVRHFSALQGTGARMKVGIQVYGRPALFTARLDAPHFQGQRSLISSRGERFYLDRGDGGSEALSVRPHTALSLLQFSGELTKMGIDYFVVDISQGQPKKESAEVTALLSGRGELPEVFTGNYTGVLS